VSLAPWIGLGLLVILLVLVVVYRQAFTRKTPSPRINHHLAALEAMVDGDADRALAQLQLAVQAGQGGADAYLRLGDLYRARGQVKKAIHLHRALAVNPKLSPAIQRRLVSSLAEDYLGAGRWDEALLNLEELRKLDGKDSAVYRRLSQVYLAKGDGEKAHQALKRAHRLEGGDRPDELAILHMELGRQLIQKQSWKEARKALQEALKQDADCLPALRLSTELYQREGQIEAAADETQRLVLTAQTGSEEDYPKMEKLFFELGRFQEIQFVYQEVLSKEPGFWPARFALARILDKRGRREEAVKLLDPALKAMDDAAGASAALLLEWGEVTRAREWLQRWTEERPREILGYRCRNCATEHPRPRWYCPACHGFKSYDPILQSKNHVATV
jgi:lipopolysaccharide biosynthesis regulator YciM